MTDRTTAFLDAICDYVKAKTEYDEAKKSAQEAGIFEWGSTYKAFDLREEMERSATEARQLLASMIGCEEGEMK